MEANSSEHLKFQDKNGDKLCMSEAIRDMDAYFKLTDNVLDKILHPPALSDTSLIKVMMRIHNVVCFTEKYFCRPKFNVHTVFIIHSYRPIPNTIVSGNPQKVAEETAVQVCCG